MTRDVSQMIRPIRLGTALCVAFLVAWGVSRAANSRYDSLVEQLSQKAAAEQQKLGLPINTHRKQLFDQYPSPEIQLAALVKVTPGGTADIAASGKFAQGTQFLFDSDDVEVVKQTARTSTRRTRLYGTALLPAGAAATNTYRATIRVSPDARFGFVRLHAYAPVSMGHQQIPALFVGAKNDWELSASNGWRVSLKMQGDGFKVDGDKSAEGSYSAEFFRAGETKPFEKMVGRLSMQSYQSIQNYTFTLAESASPDEVEVRELTMKMSDPAFLEKMSEAEQEKLMNRMQELQMKMMENVQALMADPAAATRKQAEFGCTNIFVQMTGAAAKGYLNCGEKVGRLEVGGKMTLATK
ncbi:MAG: hypothetical protein AB1898_22435 [Acidobacteriota bacterium]